MSQAINITKGNDHRLRVAMTRWSEPMALSSSSNVHAYAVKSLTGVRSALIVRYSSQDEGVMELDWPATLTAGCYGLEITGELEGEGQWRMAAANAVKVTQATEKGGESITMTGDSFDVVGVVTVCVGTTGVTEELRQVIADMIEEEYNASERLREEGESAREAHEDSRILAEEAREGNEQTRERAEGERQRNTQQAIADANNAAAAANTAAANAKADYVGSDNYVYRWNEATQEYVKTNLYVKGADGQDGEKGDPGTTDYNDLQNKPDLSGYITISVNNLVNYYLKSETYTKQEVQALIAAIQQFHYEIYASTSDVTSPHGNVLYLIGPTGTGADKYEEYVYANSQFVKIGDTSIDLSGYYTSQQTDSVISQALNTVLASYTTTAALTLLLAGKQDVINDLAEIRSGAALGATALQTETDPTVPAWAKQPQKPTYTAQEVGALPNSTKYGSTIDLAMDSATYVLTLSLKDQDGTVLNTKTVDLPIESVVVNGRYDAANKKIVLTLQGGSTIDVPVGDLIAGLQTEITSVNMLDADLVDDTNSTHKFVTEQEKTTWSNKQDTLVSGTNIKTINNQSILGAGNINIQGSYTPTLQSAPTSSTTTYTKDGQVINFEIGQFCRVAVTGGYDFYQLRDLVTENNVTTAIWMMVVEESEVGSKEDVTTIVAPVNATDATLPITALTCEVGKYYRIDVAVETLAITLPAMTDLTTVRTVVIYLTAGTTPAITIASADSKDVYYQDGYEIEAGNTYEINALFNGAAWIVAGVKIVVPVVEEEEEGGE